MPRLVRYDADPDPAQTFRIGRTTGRERGRGIRRRTGCIGITCTVASNRPSCLSAFFLSGRTPFPVRSAVGFGPAIRPKRRAEIEPSRVESAAREDFFKDRTERVESCRVESSPSSRSLLTRSSTMAPHHHLRASFIANPVLFSFPAAATAVVAPLCRAAAGPSTATTLVKDDVVVRPVESGFWRAFKAGTVGARNRERGLQLGQGQGQEVEKQGDKGMVTRKRKRALVFAGLVSFPWE